MEPTTALQPHLHLVRMWNVGRRGLVLGGICAQWRAANIYIYSIYSQYTYVVLVAQSNKLVHINAR